MIHEVLRKRDIWVVIGLAEHVVVVIDCSSSNAATMMNADSVNDLLVAD